jgi:hypothetical protein
MSRSEGAHQKTKGRATNELGRAFSAKTMKLRYLGFRFAPPQATMGRRYAANHCGIRN